ncbi:MAG: DUF1572 domain-containing protein [Cyclobacteriaceae bacterium]|nr:DUF1572 domain-containing protein [Cyclobacteriaceae bacterium]
METISQLLIEETRYRLLEESIPRLKKCLARMTADDIWYRANHQTVSAGNLVLHLCGNVKQWLISGLGGRADHRDRDKEFQEEGPLETPVLVQMLDDLSSEINQILNELDDVDLQRNQTIQGYQVTGVSILVHVVEHFSYHVGQVTYMVKSRKAVDMGYYQGKDLNQLNRS